MVLDAVSAALAHLCVLAFPGRRHADAVIFAVHVALDAQVRLAAAHAVAEVSFQTLGPIAGTVASVRAPILLVAADAALTAQLIAKLLTGRAAAVEAFLSGDAIDAFGPLGARVGGDAIIGARLADPAFAVHVIAGIRFAGAIVRAIGTVQTIGI
jgi:hypothetical protein